MTSKVLCGINQLRHLISHQRKVCKSLAHTALSRHYAERQNERNEASENRGTISVNAGALHLLRRMPRRHWAPHEQLCLVLVCVKVNLLSLDVGPIIELYAVTAGLRPALLLRCRD
ncbi:hypothetical protein EYF80_004934 [Liparis tanakae]|uniref:Uncharacterized protein n=1 Tax=Liparis tanakae TaxID=230148 RepID=A0A4Z2J3U1_9TELE|nr:hypothetical protein EYF80_004934 [Liparis tanakae]